MRSRPELDGVTVLGPSLARRTGHLELGDLSAYLDAGNIHAYPGGFVPTRNMDVQLSKQTVIAGAKSAVVTETGYHNPLNTQQQHYPVTELVAANHMPRLLLEYHRRGVRSYLYELFDQTDEPTLSWRGQHFGLTRADGTRKPAYGAVRKPPGPHRRSWPPLRPRVAQLHGHVVRRRTSSDARTAS